MSNALKIDAKDNVAVVTVAIKKGDAIVIGNDTVCRAIEDIKPGHKIALVEIPRGGPVIRYGEVILEAVNPIARGEWVHLHNTRPVLK